MFSPEVSDKLEYYVYRLIDPRNGDTFYVGKGKGNRVFDHVKGEVGKQLGYGRSQRHTETHTRNQK